MKKPSRHRYPMIIGQAIWQYHRFNQSYRDVREQLLYRGIDMSHETTRNLCYKFGKKFLDVIFENSSKEMPNTYLKKSTKTLIINNTQAIVSIMLIDKGFVSLSVGIPNK